MSRAEREREQLASERWPALSSFFRGEAGRRFVGLTPNLATDLSTFTDPLALSARIELASECNDFREYFRTRYDEGRFLADGFGLLAARQFKERDGDARVALLYSVLASSIRREKGDWKL
jgi:hypothetical protein